MPTDVGNDFWVAAIILFLFWSAVSIYDRRHRSSGRRALCQHAPAGYDNLGRCGAEKIEYRGQGGKGAHERKVRLDVPDYHRPIL